jgi:hypothetical protein
MKTAMKILGLLLFFSISISAQARCISQSISGALLVDEKGVFLVSSATGSLTILLPGTEAAKTALDQLETQDFISGFGCQVQDTLILSRIEFVGLHRLIGLWKSTIRVNVAFRDFNRVSFGRKQGRGNLYRYALAPNQGKSWRVFLSDDESVTMGNITIDKEAATMELFDPDTGNLEERFSLKKIY